MKRKASAAAITCSLLIAATGAAATLYGVRNPGDGGRQVVIIDPVTAAVTPVSASISPPLPSQSGVTALDLPGGRVFFIATPTGETIPRIYTVSTATGLVIGTPPQVQEGDTKFPLGMIFDDLRKTLLIWRNPGDGGRQVASLNSVTGVVSGISASISPPLPSQSGLQALDTLGHRFFFIAGSTPAIYTVDTLTGAVLSSPPVSGGASTFFIALAYDGPEGVLYGIWNPGTGGRQVATINPATGTVTPVGTGVASLPTQSGVAALDANLNRFTFEGSPSDDTVNHLYTLDTSTGALLYSPGETTAFYVGLVDTPPARPQSDFNTDWKTDLVWRHASSGSNVAWLMNGVAVATTPGLQAVTDPAWKIVGVGDFQGDGKADLLWRNSNTGDNAMWLMNGTTVAVSVSLPPVPDLNWTVAVVGDFQGDGKADIMWHNGVTGTNSVWLMDGPNVAVSASLPTVSDTNWKVAGSGDFQGDGKVDIVWRNTSTGDNAMWLMNGSTVAVSASLTQVADVNWYIAGVGDVQGDGKADIFWRNSVTGSNSVWMMNGSLLAVTAALPTVADTNWKIAKIGDVQGDGKADIIWRHAVAGTNSLWLMNGPAVAVSTSLPSVVDVQWQIVP